MNNWKTSPLIACAVLAVSALCICSVLLARNDSSSAAPPADAPLPEAHDAEVAVTLPLFHRVNADYLRGSKPNRGGVSALAHLGVKTIVDLRSSYDRTGEIQEAASKLGLIYYSLPLSVWDPPTDQQTQEFVRFVMDGSNVPVFVFCADGLNRTGEMTAIYRVAHDGWDIGEALKEMDEAGFNPYYWSLRQYVWTYARKVRPDAIPPHGRGLSPAEK